MEIRLIRHTRPAIPKGICYGQTDLLPADSFLEEVSTIKAQLVDAPSPMAIFTSPLLRCSRLAEALFPHHAITADPRLMELDFGQWEMKAWEEIPSAEITPWMEDFVRIPCTGGESYQQLYDRCVDRKSVV